MERKRRQTAQTWQVESIPRIQSAFSFFLKLAVWQTGLIILGLIFTNAIPCPQELYLEYFRFKYSISLCKIILSTIEIKCQSIDNFRLDFH
jgi:hypothetical protein